MSAIVEKEVGDEMYQWAKDLYPICRSLSGDGVRDTLYYIKDLLPHMDIHEVPTGTQAFDWTVPNEWNIKDAYVADLDGNRIIDFHEHNLHVVGYSEPIDEVLPFCELDKHLYSLPEQPNAIPYVTSYYKKRWGFCLTENMRNLLRKSPNKKYVVKIDSKLEPGSITYGECIIRGETSKEILLSTYICHPSMANNELSGPCVTAALTRILSEMENRRYTYRILFLVETIGSIVYLSKHLDEMRRNTEAGFVLTCIGDDREYSYVKSRVGNTIADRVIKHVFKHQVGDHKEYSFLDRGSDERQYCSPGIDLPVCCICRSKYREYPEYHTSLDDLSFISPEGLQGGFDAVKHCLWILEGNKIYRSKVLCEPHLGKYGLHPTLGLREKPLDIKKLKDLIAYADGNHDLIDIAEVINVYAGDLIPIAKQLVEIGLLEES